MADLRDDIIQPHGQDHHPRGGVFRHYRQRQVEGSYLQSLPERDVWELRVVCGPGQDVICGSRLGKDRTGDRGREGESYGKGLGGVRAMQQMKWRPGKQDETNGTGWINQEFGLDINNDFQE
jgi:hypothetical protein